MAKIKHQKALKRDPTTAQYYTVSSAVMVLHFSVGFSSVLQENRSFCSVLVISYPCLLASPS